MRALHFTKAVSPVESHAQFVDDAPKPSAEDLASGQVLIQVFYASLNPVDYKLMETPVIKWFFSRMPAIPSQDYAGRIEAVGPDVKDLKPGQLCFGRINRTCQYGTLAEYAVVGADGCVPLPDGVDAASAAGFGCAGLTAYQSIVPYIKANPTGKNIFINGGSGGTGTWGIQIGKAMGCKIVTTCSTANVDLCRELGADIVIDYKQFDTVKSLSEQPEKFDLVIDNVGEPDELFSSSNLFLKKGAPFLQVGVGHMDRQATVSFLKRAVIPSFFAPGKWLFVSVSNKLEDFLQAGEWLAEGKIKCRIAERVALEDSADAFRRLREGRTKGKIIVVINEQAIAHKT